MGGDLEGFVVGRFEGLEEDGVGVDLDFELNCGWVVGEVVGLRE